VSFAPKYRNYLIYPERFFVSFLRAEGSFLRNFCKERRMKKKALHMEMRRA
jgi:hypothetical protein